MRLNIQATISKNTAENSVAYTLDIPNILQEYIDIKIASIMSSAEGAYHICKQYEEVKKQKCNCTNTDRCSRCSKMNDLQAALNAFRIM